MPSDIARLKYRHTMFVAGPILITGLAWAIANATTWWGGLIFGLGALLLARLGVIFADVLSDRANAKDQAGAVSPEAPDASAAAK